MNGGIHHSSPPPSLSPCSSSSCDLSSLASSLDDVRDANRSGGGAEERRRGGDGSGGDEGGGEIPPPPPPSSSLVRRVLRSVFLPDRNGDGDDEGEERWRRNRKRMAAVGAASLALALAFASWRGRPGGRRRKRRSGRGTGTASSLLPSAADSLLSMLSLPSTSSSARRRNDGYDRAVESSLSHLLSSAKSGTVARALISGSTILYQVLVPPPASDGGGDGSTISSWRKALLPPSSPSVQSDVLSALAEGGCDDVSTLPPTVLERLATPAIAALPFVYLALLYKMMQRLHRDQAGGDMPRRRRNHRDPQTSDEPPVTFRDVAGIDSAKIELEEIVSYLRDPSPYERLGASIPRGVLLTGPPGVGKTLLARAVAGEADCDAFDSCSGGEFVEVYVGRGAARVRSLFGRVREDARRNFRRRGRRRDDVGGSCRWGRWWTGDVNEPSKDRRTRRRRRGPTAVVFIDEIDALGKSRSGVLGSGSFPSFGGAGGNDEREQTLNQLLTEMDGFGDDGEDPVTIVVVAATNRPAVLDPALLRPGRFDRHVDLPLPSRSGRRDILKVHARTLKLGNDVDLDRLAAEEHTGGCSGADLRNVCNEGGMLAARDGRDAVEWDHLAEGARRVRRMKGVVATATGGGGRERLW